MYLSLHCHHQNDSCIKMGSDESHFNVLLTVRDKVTRQCPQTTPVLEVKGEPTEAESNRGPSVYQPNALPLVQTGSLEKTLAKSNFIFPVREADLLKKKKKKKKRRPATKQTD